MHHRELSKLCAIFAGILSLYGCAEGTESEGALCPPSGASGTYQYLLVGNQRCDSTMDCFDAYRDRAHCPSNAFQCGLDGEEHYYCSDGCRPGTVLCNGICIDPLTNRDFCGADDKCAHYDHCGAGVMCSDGVCGGVETGCIQGEKHCNGNAVEVCQDNVWKRIDCTGTMPICDPETKTCVAGSSGGNMCTYEGMIMADNSDQCVGDYQISCRNGVASQQKCTTTVENADPICDKSHGVCAFKCRNGFHQESARCVLNCAANLCGDGKIRICGSNGALSAAEPCPAIAHAAKYGGCDDSGTKCLVTGCENGYLPASDGKSCVGVESVPCENDYCADNSLRKCVSGVLQDAVSCSEILYDVNVNSYGCNNEKTACRVSCKSGYEANADHTACTKIAACESGNKRCTDNVLEICNGTSWTTSEDCAQSGKTCDSTSLTCMGGSTGNDWVTIVEPPANYNADNGKALSLVDNTGMSHQFNGGYFQTFQWLLKDVDFTKSYVKYTLTSSDIAKLSGKTTIGLSGRFASNKSSNLKQVAISLFNGDTAVNLTPCLLNLDSESIISLDKESCTATINNTSDLHIRIIGINPTDLTSKATLRIYSIGVYAK